MKQTMFALQQKALANLDYLKGAGLPDNPD
jgi:hypothetical protein